MTHTRALWLPCPCPPIKISKINDFYEQKNKVGVCFAERYHRYHRRTNGKENRSGAARASAANVGTGDPNKGSHVVARVSFGKGSRGDGGRRSRGGVKVIFTTGFPSFLRAALGETTTLQTWEEKENIGQNSERHKKKKNLSIFFLCSTCGLDMFSRRFSGFLSKVLRSLKSYLPCYRCTLVQT